MRFKVMLSIYICSLAGFKKCSNFAASLKETVRAEPVEACSSRLRDAQRAGCVSICAALPFDRLKARTVLLGLIRKQLIILNRTQ